ncbi:MAG: NifU family protein [Bdellovibrio sp.]|nr:NifU family protein [Bdellovibrio sp.]
MLSERATQKLTETHFLIPEDEGMSFKDEQRPGSFDFVFEHSKVPGGIHFFGLVDQNHEARPLLGLQYATNLKGPHLAFLEAAVELLQGRNTTTVSGLSVREVESFLRDQNDQPAFQGGLATFFPMLEFLGPLQKKMQENAGARGGGKRQSPVIGQDYQPGHPLIADGHFSDLNCDEQEALVHEVFDRYIRPALRVDQGEAEVVYIDGPMIVMIYKGACTHCHYALTSTLDFIQRVLQIELNDDKIRVMTDY